MRSPAVSDSAPIQLFMFACLNLNSSFECGKKKKIENDVRRVFTGFELKHRFNSSGHLFSPYTVEKQKLLIRFLKMHRDGNLTLEIKKNKRRN